MPGFKYKDIMLTWGCTIQIDPLGGPLRPCVCYNVSWQVTRLRQLQLAEALIRGPLPPEEHIPIQWVGNCFLHTTITYRLFWHICNPTPCQPSEIGPPGSEQEYPTSLADLKAQLKQALANIEHQEKALEESMQPKTVAEVEEMQGKLKEAVSELEKHKEHLKKSSK